MANDGVQDESRTRGVTTRDRTKAPVGLGSQILTCPYKPGYSYRMYLMASSSALALLYIYWAPGGFTSTRLLRTIKHDH